MLYLPATAAPLVFSFLLLKMRNRNIGNAFSYGGLFHFLITVSLRGKGHMDWRALLFSSYCLATRKRKQGSHECFLFLSMCYMKNTKNTTGGYKSHLCSPIIINWNTSKGLFDSLFVFPSQSYQMKKQKTADTGDFAFFVFIFLHSELKETKVCITDHISTFLFAYELGKRKRKPNIYFPIFYYGFGKRKTKGRYIQHKVLSVFPFFILQRGKRKYVSRIIFLFFVFCLWIRKTKRILRYAFPSFYHEIVKRKMKGRYIHGPILHAKHASIDVSNHACWVRLVIA